MLNSFNGKHYLGGDFIALWWLPWILWRYSWSVLMENWKLAWLREVGSSTHDAGVVVSASPAYLEGIIVKEVVICNITSLLAASILGICSILWVILHSRKMFRMQRNEFWLRTDVLNKIVAFIGNKAEKEHWNGNQRKFLKDRRLGSN